MKEEISEIQTENKQLRSELSSFKTCTETKIAALDNGLQNMDSLNNKINDLEKKLAEYESNGTLSSHNNPQCPCNPELTRLLLNRTAWETDSLQQYGRRENICIFGVPEEEGESTTEVVVKLARSVGMNITPMDISTSCYDHPLYLINYTRA